jgi:membrane protein DedA with SNARE-associated domain
MEHFLATWGYLALFVATFISAMALPIGAEIAIGYAGALASGELTTTGHDHLQLGLVIDKVGRYILLTHKDLDRAEAWFARRGEPFVLFGRFIPLLRSFVSLAAGLGEMAVGKFLAFTVLGCAIWCAALASIGYSLGTSWHHVIKAFSYAGYVVGALIVVAVVVAIVHRYRVVRAEKAATAQGRHVRTR